MPHRGLSRGVAARALRKREDRLWIPAAGEEPVLVTPLYAAPAALVSPGADRPGRYTW